MKTLLQKAKSFPSKSKQKMLNYGKEEQELSIAWLKGEVRGHQVSKARGHKKTDSRFYPFIALGLREAYRSGKIKIKS